MGHPKERERQVTLVSIQHAHGQRNNNKRDGGSRPEEFGLRDPMACIRACRDRFIRARSGETGDNYRDICRILSRSGPNEDLWELYTCDSTFCGVANCAIDQDLTNAQPPANVDLIINVCRGYNYYSIFDPGPPPSPKPEMCGNEVKVNPDLGGSDQQGRPSKTEEVSVEGIKTLTLQNNPSSTAFSSTSPSATPTPSTSDGNSTSTPPDIVKAEATRSSTGLAAGSKAAIGTCASIAFIVVILLALFVMQRRRKDPKGYLRAVPRSCHHHSRSFSQPPCGAHTPLITPTPSAAAVSRAAPSTPPPARLSDRKFLSLIPKPGDGGDRTAPSSSSSVYPSSEYLNASPASPAHAWPPPSYYNRLFPRHSNNSHYQNPHYHKHRRHTPVGTTGPNLPPQPPRPVVTSLLARDSASSLGSYPAATGARSALVLSGAAGSYKANSVDSGSATVTGTGTPPLSPTRAGNEMSPDIAVAAPAGPPPNRALPPTPPLHHHHHQQQQQCCHPLPSPTSTLSVPVSPRSPTFSHPHSPPQQHHRPPVVLGGGGASPAAIGSSEKLHHYHETIGVALPGPPTTVTAAAGSREDLSARDLCELTESYARETRESWGSWSGTGGGGPGVGGGGAARKRVSGNNSPMRCSGDRKASGGGGAGGHGGTAVALRDLDLEKLGGSY
ncbi:hypothetical protein DL771_006380 [Monosporascus sp. 5C6A]|nr:hypothetical protein DL771_006380 [Monosporascus sp. 5C6A]